MRSFTVLCCLLVVSVGCDKVKKSSAAPAKAAAVTPAQFKERASKFITEITAAADELDSNQDRDKLMTAGTFFMIEHDRLLPIPDEIKTKEQIQKLLKGTSDSFNEAAVHARDRITETKLHHDEEAAAAKAKQNDHITQLKEQCEQLTTELAKIQ